MLYYISNKHIKTFRVQAGINGFTQSCLPTPHAFQVLTKFEFRSERKENKFLKNFFG